jgi:tetratricopeptide (TPR) repeat protein
MEQQANGLWRLVVVALGTSVMLAGPAVGQQQPGQGVSQEGASRARQGSGDQEGQAPSTNIDQQTAATLSAAIELLNNEDYAGADAKLKTLRLDRLSPYERGTTERIMFSIAYAQERYEDARGHLKAAIDSGGLNAQQIDEARYQSAQMYMQEEKWREGAAALEEWFKTAANPNSAAYYLLAIAYYQMEDLDRALPPAKKAVELMDRPNESWIQTLSYLYIQREEYREAIPLLKQLVAIAPEKKTYWMQLSSIYGQIEDYTNALAVMQVANNAGLVTEDAEVRRLADLLLFADVPYRGAQVLEAAIEKKTVNVDEKLYEKLANCWIAAREYDKAVSPLQRAAELSPNGDLFVRLGEVQAQREDWPATIAAIERGIAKGQLRDLANANLWIGIAHYTQKDYDEAVPFFQRARQSERYRQTADQYLGAIRVAQEQG